MIYVAAAGILSALFLALAAMWRARPADACGQCGSRGVEVRRSAWEGVDVAICWKCGHTEVLLERFQV